MTDPNDRGVSRRRLFHFVAAGGLAAALGSVVVAVQPTVMRTPAGPLLSLSPKGFSILAALADRICPGGAGFPKASDVQVAEAIDALMARVHPGDVADLEVALTFFENALPSLILDGRGRPFTGCGPATQDAAVDAFRRSALGPRRQVFKATYGLVAGAYWANKSLNTLLGYPGQPDYGHRRAGPGVSRAPIERRALEPRGPLEPAPEPPPLPESDE